MQVKESTACQLIIYFYFQKNVEAMDGRDFQDYNYYDPNPVYMADGGIMPQQAYFHPGQGQWGYQGQGYNPAPQFYGGYPQVPVNYGYGYDNQNGTTFNNQQNFQGYENQENSNRRSKHSYSQNRSRNRPRYDQRQQNTDHSGTSHSMVGPNENQDIASTGASTNSNSVPDQNLETNESNVNNNSNDNPKPHERHKGRGGRFHGVDSRTKHYDRDKQIADRHKGYNKTYKSDDATKAANKDTFSETTDKTGGSREDSKGARPKSYKDHRNKDRNNQDQGRRDKDVRDRHNYRKNNEKAVDNTGGDSEERVTKEDLTDGVPRENNGRKKKKDYQVRILVLIIYLVLLLLL